MDRDRKLIEQGTYYAWDAVAGVALVDRAAVQTSPMAIGVKQDQPEEGRTAEMTVGPVSVQVALGANAAVFRQIFTGALVPRVASAR